MCLSARQWLMKNMAWRIPEVKTNTLLSKRWCIAKEMNSEINISSSYVQTRNDIV